MYELLIKQLDAVLKDEKNFITNTANFSAFIFNNLPDLNWAGFYFYDGEELLLGPFQGQPACVRIRIGKGVCGTSALKRKIMVIDNVDNFDGHIACDSNSKSEMVFPLIKNEELIGVFDIDSPKLARFKEDDKKNIELMVEKLLYLSDTDIIKKLFSN